VAQYRPPGVPRSVSRVEEGMHYNTADFHVKEDGPCLYQHDRGAVTPYWH